MTDIGRSCVPALCRPTGTYICVKHLAHMSYVICTVTYGGGGGGGHLINLCKSLCRSM